MVSPFDRERMENWASDFLESPAASPYRGAGTREFAGQVLVTLLDGACSASGHRPTELEPPELRKGFMDGVAKLELPESVTTAVPDLVAGFLEYLETEGRLSKGRSIGLELRAMREPFLRAAGASRQPIQRPGAKISPNSPCQCGSGRKFKKCCQV